MRLARLTVEVRVSAGAPSTRFVFPLMSPGSPSVRTGAEHLERVRHSRLRICLWRRRGVPYRTIGSFRRLSTELNPTSTDHPVCASIQGWVPFVIPRCPKFHVPPVRMNSRCTHER